MPCRLSFPCPLLSLSDSHLAAFHPIPFSLPFISVSKVFGKNSIGNATVPFVAATYFVYHMVVVGVHTVEILFVKYVFKWGADSIGLFGSIHGLFLRLVPLTPGPGPHPRVS